jgi:hypothetical protein
MHDKTKERGTGRSLLYSNVPAFAWRMRKRKKNLNWNGGTKVSANHSTTPL